MNKERPTPADRARNEPSAARAESCTCGGVEPDPTSDNLRALSRLRDLALAVAEKLAARILDDDAGHPAAQATAPGEPGDAPKRHGQLPAAVLAFQRAERGVRQCILLSNKLHGDRLARGTPNATAPAEAGRQRPERRKGQVARPATEAIERDAEGRGGVGSERVERLDARIDQENIETDIGRIADGAIIARLSKDCGVEAPLGLRAGEHGPLEEVRLETPGSADAGSPRTASPEPGPGAVEPVEAELAQPGPPQPDNPHAVRMKARLAMAMRSGAWLMALQMDPALTSYVRSRLIDSS